MNDSNYLSTPEIIGLGTEQAQGLGLCVTWRESDDVLHGEIVGSEPAPSDSDRKQALFHTYGTGAFLVEFDNIYEWQTFAYSREDQLDAVREIMSLVAAYLAGQGETRRERNWRGKEISVLSLKTGEEEVRLRRTDVR